MACPAMPVPGLLMSWGACRPRALRVGRGCGTAPARRGGAGRDRGLADAELRKNGGYGLTGSRWRRVATEHNAYLL